MKEENDIDYKPPQAKLIDNAESNSLAGSDSINTGEDCLSPHSDSDQTTSGNSSTSSKVLIGQMIGGHYEILSILGEGGISVVYKANHVLLDAPAAIKFLLPGTELDANAIMRFQREAQAMSELRHPSIVGIREFGIHRAIPYLVLEYVEGESLADLIESKGKLEPQRALSLLHQMLEALSFAHKNKVIHRDLKPSNIMVYKTKDGAEVIKIIDFGIAKVLEGDEQRNLTKTGDVLGSPSYMSPEQCKGEKVDYRSDIYSIGCVAIEMFSGRAPFSGNRPIEVIMEHLSKQHKNLKPIKGMRGLNQVMDAALAKDPKDRYQSCDEFLQDLDLIAMRKEPVGKPRVASKFNLKRFLITSSILLACFLAFYIWFLTAFQTGTIESATKEIAKDPSANNYMLRARLYRDNGYYKEALADTAKSIDLQPKNNFWAHKINAEVYLYMNDLQKALDQATEAIAADPTQYRGYLARGTILSKLDRDKEAIEDLNKSLELNHDTYIGNMGNNRSISLYYRGCSLNSIGQFDKALKDIDQALESFPSHNTTAAGRSDIYHTMIFMQRARANLGLRRFDEALKDAQTALDDDPANPNAKQVMESVRKGMTDAQQSK